LRTTASLRVFCQQLPEPQLGGQFLRPLILVGMSALASALTYVLSDGGRFILVKFQTDHDSDAVGRGVRMASGMLVMAGGIFAAMSKTTRFNLRFDLDCIVDLRRKVGDAKSTSEYGP